MTEYKITTRIEVLFICLQFSKDKTALLTVGERICINQEIASLLLMLKKPDSDHRKVSEKLEVKIQEMKKLIDLYEFTALNPIPYEPFNID